MMKIEPINPISAITALQSHKSPEKTINTNDNFAKLVETNKTKSVSDNFPLNQVNSMLVLQEVESINDNLTRKKKRLIYAQELLKKLKLMRLSILQNHLNITDLENIIIYLTEISEKSEDIILEQIINEIEILASVTIAKLKKII